MPLRRWESPVPLQGPCGSAAAGPCHLLTMCCLGSCRGPVPGCRTTQTTGTVSPPDLDRITSALKVVFSKSEHQAQVPEIRAWASLLRAAVVPVESLASPQDEVVGKDTGFSHLGTGGLRDSPSLSRAAGHQRHVGSRESWIFTLGNPEPPGGGFGGGPGEGSRVGRGQEGGALKGSGHSTENHQRGDPCAPREVTEGVSTARRQSCQLACPRRLQTARRTAVSRLLLGVSSWTSAQRTRAQLCRRQISCHKDSPVLHCCDPPVY